MSTLEERVKDIENKDVIKQVNYIAIKNISLKAFGGDNIHYETIYFDNLVTITGKKLPAFKKPPIMLLISNYADFHVDTLTNSYVKIYQEGSMHTNMSTIDLVLNMTVTQ